MVKLLTSDILIADVITPLQGNTQLEELVERHGLKPGGKTALTKEQFEEFSAAVTGHPVSIVPGGSSANVVTTLSKLLGAAVEVFFLGVIGDGMYSSMIRQSLDEARITLLPSAAELANYPTPQTALSYIPLYADGQRTIATYPGNARDILKPELVTDSLVAAVDVLLVQGSLWQKLDWAFADKLLELRWEHDKELWLAMPTHAKFGEEKAHLFKWLIPSANVILSNEEELARVYGAGADTDQALRLLQQAFADARVLEDEGKHQRREQVGFITCGAKGAAIVTAEGIDYIDPPEIAPEDIVNTLGAGDTAFAGFAAGHLMGLPYRASAQLAMALAGQKLLHNGPRLADPQGALQTAAPFLARLLLDAIALHGRGADLEERKRA